MDKSNIGVAQGLFGELSTDYFDFYCAKCGNKIPNVVFYSVDSVGVQLLARCKLCNFSYIFKVKTEPTLGPIQITSEFGKTSYNLFDRRRLKKKLRELGHTDV
jgi:DNA-directed RNA polymerase subunit RPC12/RpoP